MHPIIDKINESQINTEIADFGIGDTVRVQSRIVEGEKERLQAFTGTVISRNGCGANESFTVRRVSYGIGAERVFPVHSPRIAKIEVQARGDVKRAKLYYLRKRVGKSARVRTKLH